MAKRGRDEEQIVTARETCLVCAASLVDSELFTLYRICPTCRFHYSATARERIATLADPGTFRETNRSVTSLDPLSFSSRVSYKARLFSDQRRTGLTGGRGYGDLCHWGKPLCAYRPGLRLHGRQYGMRGGREGGPGFRARRQKEAPRRRCRHQRRLSHSRGRAFVNADGQDRHGRLPARRQGAGVHYGAREPRDGPGVRQLRQPGRRDPGRAGSHSRRHAAEVHQGVQRRASPQAAPTRPSPISSTGWWTLSWTGRSYETCWRCCWDLLSSQYRLTERKKGQRQEGEPTRPQAWDSVQLARHESRPTSLDYIARVMTNFVELHGDRRLWRRRRHRLRYRTSGRADGRGHRQRKRPRRRFGGPPRRKDVTGGTSEGPKGYSAGLEVRAAPRHFHRHPWTGAEPRCRGEGSGQRHCGNDVSHGGPHGAVHCRHHRRGRQRGRVDSGRGQPRTDDGERHLLDHLARRRRRPSSIRDEGRADEVAESLKLTAQDCREMGIVDLVVSEPPGGAHTSPDEAARELRRVPASRASPATTPLQEESGGRAVQEVPEDGRVQLALQVRDDQRGQRAAGPGCHPCQADRTPRRQRSRRRARGGPRSTGLDQPTGRCSSGFLPSLAPTPLRTCRGPLRRLRSCPRAAA